MSSAPLAFGRLRRLALLVAATLALLATPAGARDRTKVVWTEIRVPFEGGARQQQILKEVLRKAARKADWGGARRIEATVEVRELTFTVSGDVLRARCTLVGRLARGPSARSYIAFGGRVHERAQLEKQVLTLVAHGVVTRLAALAREREAREERAKEQEEAPDGG